MIFLVVPMVSNSIVRATGHPRFPAMVMMTSALTNIILDPIFIWGLGPIPAMGIEGAAWASVLSKALAFVAYLWVIHFKYHLLDFKIPSLSEALGSWKEILRVGMPTAASNVLIPVSASIVTALIAPYGKEAVAAFGIVSRVEALALIVVYGLGASLGPFSGQNFGAKRFDRLQEGFLFSLKISAVWVLLTSFLLVFFGRGIIAVFDNNEQVIAYGALYLMLVPFSYIFEACRLLANSAFNGTGHPLPATFFVLLRMFILYIPLAYLLANYFGLEVKGIFWACTASNAIVGLISIFYLRRLFIFASSKATS
jgi:putative MATE family efflux protein